MRGCLEECQTLIQNQYKSYYKLEISDELKNITKSCRAHNIDAEEVMGMFSSKKSSCPNGTLSFISAQIRCRITKYMNLWKKTKI